MFAISIKRTLLTISIATLTGTVVNAQDFNSIRKELEQVYSADQEERQKMTSTSKDFGAASTQMKDLMARIKSSDVGNLATVTRILDQYGWLSEAQIGKAGNAALSLVIQHADLATQEQYLPMMREAVRQGKARGASLAMLEDRVALEKSGKQIYGTQIRKSKSSDAYVLAPIDAPFQVDARRAALGLGPLADFVSRWNIHWNAATYTFEN
ncbi:MAG: hypothetical protein K2U26_00255 [Cyclobacteriaceae bacterium]|nr:hypothetical protein [Cyclobacteriaceae bacterium]